MVASWRILPYRPTLVSYNTQTDGRTDGEEHKGRKAAVLSKKLSSRKMTHSFNSLYWFHVINTWRSCIFQISQVGVRDQKGHHDLCWEQSRPFVSIDLLLLDTNLFDVIASLGTGLYVHHIELTSFPLCCLDRNLPAMIPGWGRVGLVVEEVWRDGRNTHIQKK